MVDGPEPPSWHLFVSVSPAGAVDASGPRVGPVALIRFDANGDGAADVAVSNWISGNVSVLLGRGDGTFRPAAQYSVGGHPLSVQAGDFDGDRDTDVATANSVSDHVSILLGAGDGTFSAPSHFLAGRFPGAVEIGDFDWDGGLDLAVSNLGSADVSILGGRGDGTFGPPVSYSVDALVPGCLRADDLNADGLIDLATSNVLSGSGNASALLGRGDGTFGAARTTPTGVVAMCLRLELGRTDREEQSHNPVEKGETPWVPAADTDVHVGE